MDNSFLYHVHGIRAMRCTKREYKGSDLILRLEEKEPKKYCNCCNSPSLVRNGYRFRKIITLPTGSKRTFLDVKVQRYSCRRCGKETYTDLPFVTGNCSYTHRFATYAVSLVRKMTIKDAAQLLRISWDTVKDIHLHYLRRYKSPSLTNVHHIGIDEFAVQKGQVYKTIVVDLDSARIIHVGDGKGAEALEPFWKRIRRNKVNIRTVSTDLSPAYIAAVMKNLPNVTYVFDHFHVIKLMNDALDKIRRVIYNQETSMLKKNVIKGTRYLLLKHNKDISDNKQRERLNYALEMNEPLSKAYYLKESLGEIWKQPNKDIAEKALTEWCKQAQSSGVRQLQTLSNTIAARRTGILAWYDHNISNAKVEGINNKIKVLKRTAYGFRDNEYFKLRLFALHDCRITQNVG